MEAQIMPRGPVPASFHDLLESTAFAFVSTLGKDGEPQVNPVWFLWDGERLQLGMVEGRQKYVNVKRDPRIAIAIANPANPYRYLEIRGRVDTLEPDVDDEIMSAISRKYSGQPYNPEAEDGARFVATVTVERYTAQDLLAPPAAGS
jgi:PPOX class probable F420-dependent enzyme